MNKQDKNDTTLNEQNAVALSIEDLEKVVGAAPDWARINSRVNGVEGNCDAVAEEVRF